MSFTNETARNKWKEVLTLDIMSSEESGVEADDDVLYVRPLPWRSEKVVDMLKILDEKAMSGKSRLSRRQRKRRVRLQTSSSDQRPTPTSCPSWMIVA